MLHKYQESERAGPAVVTSGAWAAHGVPAQTTEAAASAAAATGRQGSRRIGGRDLIVAEPLIAAPRPPCALLTLRRLEFPPVRRAAAVRQRVILESTIELNRDFSLRKSTRVSV